MKPIRIVGVEPRFINVSEKTNWCFVKVVTDQGLSGVRECTLNGYEALLEAYAVTFSREVAGRTIPEVLAMCTPHAHLRGGPVEIAVKSAVDQALWDIRGQAAGAPVHELLGARYRDRLRVYANINRALDDRSAEGFVAAAKAAVAEGYDAIKITPFDHVFWQDMAGVETRNALALGIERIRAVREGLRQGIDLMVDCHWRFTEATAFQLLRGLADVGLFWLECPISETPENHPALARLRALRASSGSGSPAPSGSSGSGATPPSSRPSAST